MFFFSARINGWSLEFSRISHTSVEYCRVPGTETPASNAQSSVQLTDSH
jgi:hypothetical protein